jgi:hypothetical protein
VRFERACFAPVLLPLLFDLLGKIFLVHDSLEGLSLTQSRLWLKLRERWSS